MCNLERQGNNKLEKMWTEVVVARFTVHFYPGFTCGFKYE